MNFKKNKLFLNRLFLHLFFLSILTLFLYPPVFAAKKILKIEKPLSQKKYSLKYQFQAYQNIYQAFLYDRVRDLSEDFKGFYQKYPKSPFLPHVLLLQAKQYYWQQSWGEALLVIQRLERDHVLSAERKEALYLKIQVLKKLKLDSLVESALKLLEKDYQPSLEWERAQYEQRFERGEV